MNSSKLSKMANVVGCGAAVGALIRCAMWNSLRRSIIIRRITPDDRGTHQCTLRNDFTVAIGMFRGPIEMDVGDRLEVMRRSR
jgi:hypothetical protein